ncbi:hypothetical protein IB237_14940 [Agrobacterium sp. AGB01]|uniref:hypothetical protein n=1 Tax=Agrobacterium sp. AGB01 TaxID=2769302 RepID=UPI0017807F07|nr:hypothetical protein [Agrobacterium sp. AGB01]MBD9388477.1 hypothetical protein [Agrobacterium sp. AGB01]
MDIDKPAHRFPRWFVLLTFPLSVIVTTAAFLAHEAKLQALLIFLNAFYLECPVLFVKSLQLAAGRYERSLSQKVSLSHRSISTILR